MNNQRRFLDEVRHAGILPSDSGDVRLQKSLLVFATGLISFASMLWLLICWQLGPPFSSTVFFDAQQDLLVVRRTRREIPVGDDQDYRRRQYGRQLLEDRFDFGEPQTLYLKGKMVVHRAIGRKPT